MQFFLFGPEIPFLVNFGQKKKNQNCQFKLKFGTKTNWNMQNSMVMFILFVLDKKYHFLTMLVQKNKSVSLSWNLVPRLIRICRIEWAFSLFFVLDGKHPFWADLFQKTKIVSLGWNLVSKLIRICRIQWWCSFYLF